MSPIIPDPFSSRKPNVLMLIVDEFRYPPRYESEALKEWKEQNLHFARKLKEIGTEFHNHYTNTNACVPARTTLQTGVYPNVHGNKQTDGAAKQANDPLMHWLEPGSVPTMGNYLRQNGYKTVLKGKWHITDASIRGDSDLVLPTCDFYGVPIPKAEEFYLKQNVLNDYGYEGWIGPEPHGRLGIDSGSSAPPPKLSRDEKFVAQAIETLSSLDKTSKPWFLCTNLVDPHDIVLYGDITQTRTKNFVFVPDPTLPEVMWTEDFVNSMNDDLSLKPATQNNYRTIYPTAFQPITDIDAYWRYYFTLQKRVDAQLMEIYNKLMTTRNYKNTVIVYTSDHGDLLGSHGKLFQKWYQAYEEALHVPLIIGSPAFQHPIPDIYDMTSHIDLLPTLIDISKGNLELLRSQLQASFSLAVELPGKSIYPYVFGSCLSNRPVYFYTEDNPTQGNNQVSLLGVPYDSIAQPNACEALIIVIDGVKWKITFYYNPSAPLRAALPTNRELYNLNDDPFELNNLILNPSFLGIRQTLEDILTEKSFLYRNMLNQL